MTAPTVVLVRNEVDPDQTYHCDAIARALEGVEATVEEIDYPAGERPDLETADGVILSGSTAGVYETDAHPWIADQEALIHELIDRSIPTLGICFSHQLVNRALGGTVEARETHCRPVEASLAADPLFAAVGPVVAVAHGDFVTTIGDDLELIGSADYYSNFATRHTDAPLWTVQFHPEFTTVEREWLVAEGEWTDADVAFDEVEAIGIFETFVDRLAEPASTEVN